MFFTRFALASTVAAVIGAASADLAVLAPGGQNLWWVAQSSNNIVWNCKESSYQNFTILIANQDTSVMSAPQALIAIQENYDCSKMMDEGQSNLTPAQGYIVQLANPLNATDVYAQSEPFEIKAKGAIYPASSATPTGTNTATSSGSATGSGSSASSTSSSDSSSGASGLKVSTTLGGLALVAAAMGML